MMKIHKGETVELRIDRMAFGGQGVARVNGYVVFVRGGVPGDRLTARIYRKKKDYAEAKVVELIDPSPDRVQAPCPYSGYCGGCQWQHLNYETQLSYKKAQVKDSLVRTGGLDAVLVRDVLPAEKIFAYRNKMEFSFSDRRWFLTQQTNDHETEGGFALGLHVSGAYQKVIDIEACLLQSERGNRILREVKEYVAKSRVPIYGLKSHSGFWRFLTLRHSTAFDEWMVNVITSEARPEVIRPLADMLAGRIKQIKTVVNNVNRRKASIAVGESEIVLMGEGYIRDKIGPFTFQISANSFFQTNTAAALNLYQAVVNYAEITGSETVLDLYSGTGTIPIFLANRVRSVIGIEINESAVLDARRNCIDNRIDNCRFICGDIQKEIIKTGPKPDVLIIDPPRAGMHKRVRRQVMDLAPEKIVYISCNPVTLARDVGRMTDRYELIEIQPVDMFPHTYHIEAAAKLQLRKSI
jgi:23S rRNA (uracil1939-C5)-methyltransferase